MNEIGNVFFYGSAILLGSMYGIIRDPVNCFGIIIAVGLGFNRLSFFWLAGPLCGWAALFGYRGYESAVRYDLPFPRPSLYYAICGFAAWLVLGYVVGRLVRKALPEN